MDDEVIFTLGVRAGCPLYLFGLWWKRQFARSGGSTAHALFLGIRKKPKRMPLPSLTRALPETKSIFSLLNDFDMIFKKGDRGRTKNKKLNTIVLWLTIGGAIVGVLGWLHIYRIDTLEERHVTEITELNTRIASIERNIGDSDYFDVRNMFYSADESGGAPDEASAYIPSGNFYADTTNPNWIYRKFPPVAYLKKELKINPIEFYFGIQSSITLDSIFRNPAFRDYEREYRFHLLRHVDSIDAAIGAKTQYFNSSISVFVVRKDVMKTIFDVLHENISREENLIQSFNIDTSLIKQAIEVAERQYDKNSSGLIFNLLINSMVYSSLYKGNILELQNIQKKSDVFYTKYKKEYKANVNKVYETGEIFFADKNGHIYIVLIKLYSKEPLVRTEVVADINKWLYSLKFL